MNNGDDGILIVEKVVEKSEKNVPSSSSSTSSIGKNSDDSGKSMENPGDTEEVQSIFKGPLEAMEDLEDVLPMRRGISRFYNGKSKSYGSLSDATSIKDIAKPENTYMKRRRNLLSCSIAWDHNNRTYPPSLRKVNNGGRGISKRPVINSNSRATALAFALRNNDNTNTRLDPLYEDAPFYGSSSSSSPRFRKLSPWRSFSLADLQRMPGTSLEHIPSSATSSTK